MADPLSYEEYDDTIDLKFETKNKVKPIICVPIIDKES